MNPLNSKAKHSTPEELFNGFSSMNQPMVEINVELNASSENRNSTQVLPTPESPISNSLKRKSYVLAIPEHC